MAYRVEHSGGRVGLTYRASKQANDVRRYVSVAFDVQVTLETQVDVSTSNGAISLENLEGTMVLDTSNGPIDVHGSSGRLTAETSIGRIEVIRFAGSLDLSTSNGELWAEDVVGRIDAETSNGSVHYVGTPATGLNRIRTSNASVTERVLIDLSIAFDASTSSGRIRSTLPLVGDTQGDTWSVQLNPPADLRFQLHTSNGTIRIEGIP